MPELIVLHYTAMPSCAGARDWLCNPASEVSAHYLVDRDGTLIQMVDEPMRAWHAGAGAWGGQGDVNSRSIGIEMANTGAEPFSEPLMATLETLLEGLMARWSIPAQNVIAHSDMAPGRKIDPGARFDWTRLARQGLAQPTPTPNAAPQPPDAERFTQALTQIGYPEAALDTRLDAFRLRHAPRAIGPLSATDMGLATALASSLPKYPN
ncbi:MAG: N-acetylmuramoyl-L-alanine amidase [Polaromonas sp.]|jgi:N-acetylmuramoyl-L-alanine amidase